MVALRWPPTWDCPRAQTKQLFSHFFPSLQMLPTIPTGKVKNNPTSAMADNIDHCSNGQAPSLSIFSRRRRSENSQTNQLPNPVLWLAIISCWLSRFKTTFLLHRILKWSHFHCYQFACLFVFIVSSELLNGYLILRKTTLTGNKIQIWTRFEA